MANAPLLDKPNTLVVGGAGFIGSHLCDELIKERNVICLDDFSSSSVENIKHLLESPNFEFVKHDISKPIILGDLRELDKFKVKFQGIQEIYNLAVPTSPKNFNSLRVPVLRANSAGVVNTLELAKEYKAKYLYASSVVVYGPRFPNAPAFSEDYFGYVNMIGPRSCFDEGKRFGESAVATYRDVFGLDAKIARIFRTYGPRLSLFDGHMVSDFVLQALNNKPLVIYGDESFSTSLTYISDIIDGLRKLMGSPEVGPFNFGHFDEYKMVDIAQKIKVKTNSSSKVEFRPPMVFMSPLGLPDITLVKQRLGWYPLVPLDDGLDKMIEYVKANQFTLQAMLGKYEEQEGERGA